MSVALVSAATATATALTVGVEPPPDTAKRQSLEPVDLAAAIQLLPDSGQFPNPKTYPDLTGGLGTTVYNFGQTLADQLARAIVGGVSLTALAQAAGVDPQSLVNKLLADIPANLVPGIITTIGSTINLPLLGSLSSQLDSGQLALITNVLNLLGVDELTDGTLTGLLGLLGLNLADPFNLSNLITDKLGVNLITAGPTFSVLKMLGVDLGWVPGTPNSVANAINGSPYLKIGLNGILQTAFDTLNEALQNGTLDQLDLDTGVLGGLLGALGLPPLPIELPGIPLPLNQIVGGIVEKLGDLLTGATANLPDILHTRITPTVGIGLGAFAAAMAYKQVVADLPNQPGGSNYEQLTGDPNPLLGSLTILPLILINNPARPDGGMFARFGPLAALLGIDTVGPHTQLTGENGLPVGTTGLQLGGANVLPIMVDATYEYQPLSDFASWPNPVTLANNLAAALMPTYMLRGLSLDGLTDDLTPQLAKVTQDLVDGKPLALNLYLTLHSATLPLLEPLYLTSDVLNIVGLSPLAQIPMRIANALAPALKILTDLGYGNVTRNPDGTYTRNFDNAGDEVPFMSFPNVDPFQALGDVFNALVGGITKELGPNPTQGTPNALKTLLDAVFGGGGLGGLTGGTGTGGTGTGTGGTSTGNPLTDLLGSLLGGGGLLGGLLGGLNTGGLLSPQSVTAVPNANARLLSVASTVDTTDSSADKKDAAADSSADKKDAGTDTGTEKKDAATDLTVTEVKADTKTDTKTESAAQSQDTTTAQDTQAQGQTQQSDTQDPPKQNAQDPSQQQDTKKDGDAKSGPKHAKPDTTDADQSGSSTGDAKTGPKHAKPELNVVRDTANNFSTNKHVKKDAETGGSSTTTPSASSTTTPSASEGSEGTGAGAGSAGASSGSAGASASNAA